MRVGEGNKSKMNYDFLSSINKTRENKRKSVGISQMGGMRVCRRTFSIVPGEFFSYRLSVLLIVSSA